MDFISKKYSPPQTLDSKDTDKDTKKQPKTTRLIPSIMKITISKIDDTYQNSEIISSMKTTQKGFLCLCQSN